MIVKDIWDEPECKCCPIMDVCTAECGVKITVTKDMINRSNCKGSFLDAFEEISIGAP